VTLEELAEVAGVSHEALVVAVEARLAHRGSRPSKPGPLPMGQAVNEYEEEHDHG